MKVRLAIVIAVVAATVLLTWPFLGPVWLILGLVTGFLLAAALLIYIVAATVYWVGTGRWLTPADYFT